MYPPPSSEDGNRSSFGNVVFFRVPDDGLSPNCQQFQTVSRFPGYKMPLRAYHTSPLDSDESELNPFAAKARKLFFFRTMEFDTDSENLEPLLPTIVTSSRSHYPSQKGKRGKSGKFLTKWCSFSSHSMSFTSTTFVFTH
jgi:hypothetical protein